MSVKIVAPVVVNPLTISKKASVNVVATPLKNNGKAPKSDKNIQDSPTIAKPSLALIRFLSSFFKRNIHRQAEARTMPIIIEITNDFVSRLWGAS